MHRHNATPLFSLAVDTDGSQVPDEPALRALSARLDAADIPHHLWIEEPEHTPTAIALMPNKRPKGIKKILDDAGCTLWR